MNAKVCKTFDMTKFLILTIVKCGWSPAIHYLYMSGASACRRAVEACPGVFGAVIGLPRFGPLHVVPMTFGKRFCLSFNIFSCFIYHIYHNGSKHVVDECNMV